MNLEMIKKTPPEVVSSLHPTPAANDLSDDHRGRNTSLASKPQHETINSKLSGNQPMYLHTINNSKCIINDNL